MAILFAEGFEGYIASTGSSGAALLAQRWTLTTFSQANVGTNIGAQIFEDTKRGCLLVNTTGKKRISKTVHPGNNTCLVGLAFTYGANPSAPESLLYIQTGGAGSVATPNDTGVQISVVINTNRTIAIYQGNFDLGGAFLLGTSVTALTGGSTRTFQYLEVKVVIGPAGSVDVRLSAPYDSFDNNDPAPAYPSASILSLAGVNTQPHGSGTWDTVSVLGPQTFGNWQPTLDDIYIADGTGANGDFLGPIVIALTTTEPYATIPSTYQSGGGGGFTNGGSGDTGDGGKNIGQGNLGPGNYGDDGAVTFVAATVLNAIVTAYVDLPQQPPALPVYYTPNRGVAALVPLYGMKRIALPSPLLLAQGFLRYPGGVGGTDHLGQLLDSADVNTSAAGSTADQDQADPWNGRPDGTQWLQADVYSKRFGTNTAAAEFGIKCVSTDGSLTDCTLGKVHAQIVYGQFIPPQTVVTQLPLELIYPFPYVAPLEAATDAWAPASAEDGSAGSATSGPSGSAASPGNVGGCLPLQAFIDALAARLGDTAHVHWTAVELQRYLIEALRTYNACTQSLRNRGVFLSTATAPFYDLPTVLPSLRGYNVTDLDLILDLEYALLEPPALGTWTGSSQFTLADLVAAVQRRRDLFLRETGAVLTREVRAVTPPASGRILFPDDVITIRRAAWISSASVVTPLHRDDAWGLTQYAPTWPRQSVNPAATWPTVYAIGVTPPLTLQVAPPITDAGSLDLVSVLLGATLGSSAPGVLLGVPDDWAWVVKFGALADLLSQQGVAFDPARAAYAEARWTHGLRLATAASVVLAAQINGGVVPITSVSESDTYDPTWQTTAGVPTLVLIAGQTLLALSPPPDAGSASAGYTVTVDLVVNFPVPITTTDCVDVDKSVMEIVIDYAQHLAMFKEFNLVPQSMALLDKFMTACGVTVQLDVASVPNRQALFDQTIQDARIVPRRSPPEPVE